MIPALLALADGSVFKGTSIGISGQAVGEVVFNTAMTGYQEILTDPSYAQQLITLTYPHIGNTGTNPEDIESNRVWGSGLIVRDVPLSPSSWRSTLSLPDYMREQGVVGISDIDTRRLTRRIRESGAQGGCIVAADSPDAVIDEALAVAAAQKFGGLAGMDLAKVVTRADVGTWTEGCWDIVNGYSETDPAAAEFHVVAYDFGVKHNILRLLADRGCRLTIVPAQTTAADVRALKPNGVFLSNGPGDPEPCSYAIAAVKELLDDNMPMFGICLGYQIMALASGAKTEKMPHGHHGANHPVKDERTGRVMITSQNHGFAVSTDDLPNCLETTHVSLFDGSLQGLRRTDRPAFGFQGHPEASPGPQDCQPLFDEFVELMRAAATDTPAAGAEKD